MLCNTKNENPDLWTILVLTNLFAFLTPKNVTISPLLQRTQSLIFNKSLQIWHHWTFWWNLISRYRHPVRQLWLFIHLEIWGNSHMSPCHSTASGWLWWVLGRHWTKRSKNWSNFTFGLIFRRSYYICSTRFATSWGNYELHWICCRYRRS